MNHKTFRILMVAYMILILSVSSVPAQSMPKTWLLNWDKLIHLVEYFILGILAMKSMNSISYRTLLVVIPLGIVFGGLDEYLQSFISGRFSSGWDVLADTIGVSIGSLLVLGNKE
ncbi:MAG: VanZ family protein [Candidatus Marinimicrobia bacterium]|nr:VanZ family protein [Candidatus Neomarinimicrobiota bacterium]MBT4065094.1 VanZ family protein [Candidatus Neomarinimicrobiota bacterium]MBT4453248.1 VanZ family protein [Candidatus Neomarinimicrobiota bacterium]MBT6782140.1 VanZ family protein [Candidatus Neomarinimicrobiota bacterium]MBT7921080.1 VanZ family protein [Candidatus Neomarinimicrobiota bacterium]|tara:strand:- start:539 stop:883 length:345 start_codon:yes stop_codon:yes gene_type:complete